MSTGAELIAAERARQITEKGYTAEHDKGHTYALLAAANCYRLSALGMGWKDGRMQYAEAVGHGWPWASEYWKPTGDPVRDLTKAGALIAAAIDSHITDLNLQDSETGENRG